MASVWRKAVTELNFHTPYVEKLTASVNVVDVMDDSCLFVTQSPYVISEK